MPLASPARAPPTRRRPGQRPEPRRAWPEAELAP